MKLGLNASCFSLALVAAEAASLALTAAASAQAAPPAGASPAPTVAPQMLPPPPPPAGPIPTAAPAMAPPAAPAPGPVPTAAPEMNPPPPPPAPPPPPPATTGPTIGYTFGVRVGLKVQDPDKPKNMNEVHLGGAYDSTAEARFHGAVTENFSWVVNFNATLTQPTLAPGGSVGIMDVIAQYKACKEFNIWAGRLLVPSDRSNFSGPFFSLPWNYPGFYVPGAAPLGPKDGPTGRDQGAVVWGNALEDKLKYYGGVFGIDKDAQPYVSGRVSYSIQGAEPGYFGSSTYYGAKNVMTIGVGAQYQKNGAVDMGVTPNGTKDNVTFMADALAEENVPDTGTFTFEGQFYKFTDGYAFAGAPGSGASLYAPKEAFYLLAAYLTPQPIGIGKIQPLLRIQQTVDPGWTIFDAALAYVFKDYSGRVVLTYEHIDLGGTFGAAPAPVQNSFQLGLQLQTL